MTTFGISIVENRGYIATSEKNKGIQKFYMGYFNAKVENYRSRLLNRQKNNKKDASGIGIERRKTLHCA
jgi:hypothetical protein